MIGKKVKISIGEHIGKLAIVTGESMGDYSLESLNGEKLWNGRLTYFPASWITIDPIF